jgi:predicted phosphodiesterase
MGAFDLNRFAVMADIHGNADALVAVLADMDRLGIESVVNLGDFASGPLAADETLDLIAQRQMVCIRGNHDRYLIEQDPAQMSPSDRVAFDLLRPEHLEWLRSLPEQTVIQDTVFACHATPDSDETYWLETVHSDGTVTCRPQDQIEQFAVGVDFPLILCAHTHVPRSIRLSDGRMIVNPGSVGCPGYEDHHPVYHVMQTGTSNASYVVVEKLAGARTVSFRSVPYNTDRMVKLALAHGRTEWANAVASGWVFPACGRRLC